MAQHRCEETISLIYNDLAEKFEDLYHLIDNDELEKVTKSLKVLVEAANCEYLENLHRYPIHVVQLKNDVLQRRIKELVEPLFQGFSGKIEKKSFKIFELDLKSSNKQLSETSLKESCQRAAIFYRSSLQGISYSIQFFLSFRFHKSSRRNAA